MVSYMPVVQVFTWAGRTPENKEKLIKGITQVFVDLGTPASAVTVIIVDVPKDSWGREGKVATSN
jgi:4-oxalocrotonate tautomerase